MSAEPSAQRIPIATTPASARSQASAAHIQDALTALDAAARCLAKQLGRRVDVEELKEHAFEAVVDLIDRFDPARGIPFDKYARMRLRGAMLDGLRKQTGLPRGFASRLAAMRAGDLFVEARAARTSRSKTRTATRADAELVSLLRGVATASALGWASPDADEPEEPIDLLARSVDDPETHAQRTQARGVLERALRRLGEKEAFLVRRHFLDGLDLQDAAAELGFSKSWGSRLLARAVARLGERLREMQFEWCA